MISFAVNKIKYIFQFLQYFRAVITQEKTSCGFYWFSNTGKSSSSCVTLLEEEHPALSVRQAEHMNFLSWLLQGGGTNMFLKHCQMQISASQGRFPQGLWLRWRDRAANYWLLLAAECSEWIHCGLGVSLQGNWSGHVEQNQEVQRHPQMLCLQLKCFQWCCFHMKRTHNSLESHRGVLV